MTKPNFCFVGRGLHEKYQDNAAPKMTKREEKRELLERKIMTLFHAVHNMTETRERGIGKYDIKKTLVESGEKSMSINTIKRIVDEMLDGGVIECVNPHAACGVRFRLRDMRDALASFSDAVQCAQKLGVKGFKKLKV